LRAVYRQPMGYLDDLVITLRLISHGATSRFVPIVIGDEEGRVTWNGLIAQRARWTIGLCQSLVFAWPQANKLPVLGCWALHSWLYHGWPCVTVVGAVLLAASGFPVLAGILLLLHLLTWTVGAYVGFSGITRLDHSPRTNCRAGCTVLVAGLGLMLAQVLGLVLSPCYWIMGRLHPRAQIETIYRR
jgi:cellulose synthase/poly-beta-1,6-N-acetylglucosamine synthase-like glycosyltransferase